MSLRSADGCCVADLIVELTSACNVAGGITIRRFAVTTDLSNLGLEAVVRVRVLEGLRVVVVVENRPGRADEQHEQQDRHDHEDRGDDPSGPQPPHRCSVRRSQPAPIAASRAHR